MSDVINAIENLNPIDSQFKDVAEVGKKILMESIEEIGWRNLPPEFLQIALLKLKSYHKIY